MTLATPGSAQEPPGAESPRTRAQAGSATVEPGSYLEVRLLTIGPGKAIWERFSHNAIWISDHSRGSEAAYNWGVFDFRQESFIARLMRGRMLYELRSYPAPRLIEFYRRIGRDVWVQTINLTPAQRLELQRLVRADDTDENRAYRYDYYLDNCSTRVRDVLDRVLDGQIRRSTESVETGTTFRWHTARLLQPVAWAYVGIQFVLGHPGDRPISAWEEMFLPLKLRDRLEDLVVHGSDGAPTPLLGPRRRVFDREPTPVPAEAPVLPVGYVLAGLGLAAALALMARSAGNGGAAGRGFAVLGGAWNLVIGLAGTALVLSWVFTDHVFWRWNENVLQASPLSLVLGIVLPLAMTRRAGGSPGRDARALGRARAWALAVAGLSVLGALLQILPLFDQVNGVVIALMLPPHLAIAWGVMRSAPPVGGPASDPKAAAQEAA